MTGTEGASTAKSHQSKIDAQNFWSMPMGERGRETRPKEISYPVSINCFAAMQMGGMDMDGMGGMGAMMFSWIILWLLVVIVLILLIIYLIKQIRK